MGFSRAVEIVAPAAEPTVDPVEAAEHRLDGLADVWPWDWDQYLVLGLLFVWLLLGLIFRRPLWTPFRSMFPQFVDQLASTLLDRKAVLKTQYRSALADGLYFSLVALTATSIFLWLAEDGSFGRSYVVGFSSSLLQDLFLFGIVGFAIAYLGRKDPSEDNAVTRMGYMLNSEGVTDEVRQSIFSQIAPQLVFCSSMELSFTFEEASDAIGAIRVSGECHREFFNSINDREIKDTGQRFMLETDGLKILKKDHPKHAVNGQISLVSYRLKDGKTDYLQKDSIDVDKSKEIRKPILCPGGGEFETDFAFWVWHKVGKSYYWKSRHYTNEFNLVFENKTDHPITITLGLPGLINSITKSPVENPTITLQPRSPARYHRNVLKAERYDIFSIDSVGTPQ